MDFENPLLKNLLEMESRQIECKSKGLEESNTRFKAKMDLVIELQALLEPIYPKCKLIAFGSTPAKLALKNSDLDVLMIVQNQRVLGKTSEYMVLQRISNILSRHKFRIVELVDAIVPLLILEYNHPSCGKIEIDLSCTDGANPRRLCFKATLLLSTYVKLDYRFRILFIIIKAWADSKEMLGTRFSRLSSYSLVLMLIHYLQRTTPRVLPILQEESGWHDYPGMFESWKELETKCNEKLKKFISNYSSRNKDSLMTLLKDFFKFYSEFDFNEVITIRKGHISLSECKAYSRMDGELYDVRNWDKPLRIEEPFFRSNVARAIRGEYDWNRIKSNFPKAMQTIENGGITKFLATIH